MRLRRVASFLVAAACAACSTTEMIPFDVYSTPQRARIEVNGQTLGYTPCEIQLQKAGRWVGFLYGGYSYDRTGNYYVKAYPPQDWQGSETLYTQTVIVNPAQVAGGRGRIDFDLRLRGIAPHHTLEITR